jgi:hypothetical protein
MYWPFRDRSHDFPKRKIARLVQALSLLATSPIFLLSAHTGLPDTVLRLIVSLAHVDTAAHRHNGVLPPNFHCNFYAPGRTDSGPGTTGVTICDNSRAFPMQDKSPKCMPYYPITY